VTRLAFTSCLSSILLSLLFAVTSAATTALSLTPLTEDAGVYSESLQLRGDDRLVAVQVDLSFDPDTINVSSVVKGSAAPRHLLARKELAPGRLRALLTSPTGEALQEGTLFSLRFESTETLDYRDREFSLSNIEFSTDRALGVSVALVPYVEITAPLPEGAEDVGADLTVTAVSVATEGEIDHVEFFAGDLRIGVSTEEPYSVSYFPTALGAAVITAIAISDNGTSAADTVGFQLVGDPYYETWRASKFTPAELSDALLSGPLADPDLDQLPNLIEYFAGLEPRSADGLSGRMQHGTVEIDGERYLTLTLRKPIEVNDVATTVAADSDLAFAEAGTAVLHARRFEGEEEILVYRDTVPLSATDGRFLRAAFERSSLP
jgi:hypothetical protein